MGSFDNLYCIPFKLEYYAFYISSNNRKRKVH